jgi:hypothetical protein
MPSGLEFDTLGKGRQAPRTFARIRMNDSGQKTSSIESVATVAAAGLSASPAFAFVNQVVFISPDFALHDRIRISRGPAVECPTVHYIQSICPKGIFRRHLRSATADSGCNGGDGYRRGLTARDRGLIATLLGVSIGLWPRRR